VPRIEAYVACLLSNEVYNPAAIEGQQWMKKATTRASKHALTKASTSMVTADQLNHKLASARPPSPPQGAGTTVEATPTKAVGIPQMDPRPLPAPYTDVPMGDIKDILDWEPDPILNQPQS
jgi:hypothetical protein